LSALYAELPLPDFSVLGRVDAWVAGITVAIVASIETLLSVQAVDRLDPLKRHSPPDRELLAQGTANAVSGLFGGLPVTAVIVRSGANVAAGARERLSAMVHGALLLVSVLFAGQLLNLPAVSAFESYRTNASEDMVRGSDVAVTNGAFTLVAPASSVFTFTYAGTPDSVPPTLSVTAPQNGATVSGTVAVSSGTASDNVGVQGVQFELDGALLGVEDGTAPYGVQWNTSRVANGNHVLTAVARDGRGNVTRSSPVTVTVSN